MKFNGTFELEDTTVEEVWLALSDPVLIADALPGCEFLRHVESDDVDFDELVGQGARRLLGTGLRAQATPCLLYPLEAAADMQCVDIGGSRSLTNSHID